MENATKEFKARLEELLLFTRENKITLMVTAFNHNDGGEVMVLSNTDSEDVMISLLTVALNNTKKFNKMARKAIKLADYLEMDKYVKSNILGKDE